MKRDTIRSTCIIRVSGAQMRVGVLQNRYVLMSPQNEGTNSEVATSPLLSWGPVSGWYC